jgi:NADH-quinone oxidoreductase subunit M
VVYAVFAALGIILGAWYMLTMFRRVMHGPLDKPTNQELQDLTIREIAVLVPIAVLIFLIGVLPNLFFDKMGASVAALLAQVSRP